LLKLAYEKQLAVEQERIRIANNLHDDLGSSLSALNLKAQMLAQQSDDPSIRNEIGQLAINTQSLVGQIREMIWTTNSQYDTVDNLVTRLHEYALDYFKHSSVRCKVKLMPEEVKNAISGQHRQEIYLVFKEALHNIMKHAHASEVNIDIALDPGFLVIRIQDNGKGFDAHKHSSGMGIHSMQRRMQEAGGTMELTSDASGTRIALKYPL
jgi:signal transduction histidine kinase